MTDLKTALVVLLIKLEHKEQNTAPGSWAWIANRFANCVLGIPAVLLVAVICWIMLDMVIPAIDGSNLHVHEILAGTSPSGIEACDLQNTFWNRIGVIATGSFLFVGIGTGSDIRRWMIGGSKPELLAYLVRSLAAGLFAYLVTWALTVGHTERFLELVWWCRPLPVDF
jgi:hypothetical protein